LLVNVWRPTIAGSGTDILSGARHWLLFQCLDAHFKYIRGVQPLLMTTNNTMVSDGFEWA
jgi:hypothetical protein